MVPATLEQPLSVCFYSPRLCKRSLQPGAVKTNTPDFVGSVQGLRRERDSNPRNPEGFNSFRDCPIRPLWHLSISSAVALAEADYSPAVALAKADYSPAVALAKADYSPAVALAEADYSPVVALAEAKYSPAVTLASADKIFRSFSFIRISPPLPSAKA